MTPNLATRNFFLVFESHVYLNRPRTLQELRANICKEISNTTPAMLYAYSVYGQKDASLTVPGLIIKLSICTYTIPNK